MSRCAATAWRWSLWRSTGTAPTPAAWRAASSCLLITASTSARTSPTTSGWPRPTSRTSTSPSRSARWRSTRPPSSRRCCPRRRARATRRENIPTLPASDWSVVRIYPRFLRPVGPSCRLERAGSPADSLRGYCRCGLLQARLANTRAWYNTLRVIRRITRLGEGRRRGRLRLRCGGCIAGPRLPVRPLIIRPTREVIPGAAAAAAREVACYMRRAEEREGCTDGWHGCGCAAAGDLPYEYGGYLTNGRMDLWANPDDPEAEPAWEVRRFE
eukprot:7745303-Pyramimonas_sp.AAC.1